MIFLVCAVLILTQNDLLSAAFTTKVEVPEGKIVGGHEAKPHSHPYIVSLQTRLLWVGMHICGGTILSENWILTAGHCITESWLVNWLPMDAVAGAHDVDNVFAASQTTTISDRIAHPLYEGGIGPHDIALLRVADPFRFSKEIQPVNLPNTAKVNPDLTLAGWGLLSTTFFFPDLPSQLQEVKVTYVPYDECHKAVENIKESDEDNPLDKEANICTGPLSGGIAACNGDSGGPLIQFSPEAEREIDNDIVEEVTQESYYDDSDSITIDSIDESGSGNGNTKTKENYYDENEFIPILVGVVSWGASPCGQKGAPTVYTNVSRYMDFINEHINT